jgi:lipopolysaccharide/colanic/teichoic acid biosynthesis glycosyltransferase/UTP-glucose-1-phosphate uridylyltransferase
VDLSAFMSPVPETAIILAGGLATFHGFALAPYPKILLPLANRPLLHYQARVLAEAGVKRLVLCLNCGMSQLVAEHLDSLPNSLECLLRETVYGTGGSLKEVEDAILGNAFWVLSGDLLLTADLSEMLAFHRQRRATATVGVLRVLEAPWEMERVEYDLDQKIKTIHRLHPAQERRSTLRPAGLYLFQSEVLQGIPPARYFDLKEQLFAPLYQQGAPMWIWMMPGYSSNIISIGDFFTANLDILNGRVPMPEPERAQHTSDDDGKAQVSASAKVLAPTALGSGTRIGEEAIILGPSAIGSHCEIGPEVVVNECVILDNARISRGAYLNRCVISEGAVIDSWTQLHEMAVLKTLSSPPEQTLCSLREQARRHPGKVVGALECQAGPKPFYQIVKRGLDVLLALIGLTITAPLMLIIALAIKLDSSGEVFFRQVRCGRGGRNFTMYKFRSMVQNSEDLKRELVDLNEVDGPMFKILRDPRITRVGKILRDTNLDELPQLYNVLKGDMSLVGPRPLSLDEMRYNPKWRDARLSVRPGMTGLWQVEAHSKLFFTDWLVNDLEYVKQCSLGLDLKILFKTIVKVVRDLLLSKK